MKNVRLYAKICLNNLRLSNNKLIIVDLLQLNLILDSIQAKQKMYEYVLKMKMYCFVLLTLFNTK